MTTEAKINRGPASPGARARSLAATLWLAAVLVTFLVIRVLQSQSATAVLAWWKNR